MNSEPIIRVRNLSKAYRIWDHPAARISSPLLEKLGAIPGMGHLRARAASRFRDFWALQDVSFEIHRGESVGIIGRNGSGKSTLLQIIAGTLQPTSGDVKVNGRVAALLELGSGFNPEFTGRENVYLNGAVLGLSRQEVDERFERIAAFAEIGDYIDQPVKTYSSGMQLRLAFAVSINVEADILIVDEALSVGDVNFQAKCIAALRQLQNSGVSFLIVTHATDVVKSMCQRAVYLRQGRLAQVGPASDVADAYFREMREQLSAELARSQIPNLLPTADAASVAGSSAEKDDRPIAFKTDVEFARRTAPFRSGTGEARITAVELLDAAGAPVTIAAFDQLVRLRIHLQVEQDLELLIGYHIRNEHNLSILCTGTFTETGKILRGRAGDRLVAEFATRLPLREGSYNIAALISTQYIPNRTAQFVDWAEPAIVFQIAPRVPQVIWSAVYLPNEFRLWHVSR